MASDCNVVLLEVIEQETLVERQTELLIDTVGDGTEVADGAERELLAVEEPEMLLVEEERQIVLLDMGTQGPPGPPGTAGDSTVARASGEALSALRVVFERAGAVFLLDPQADDEVALLLGITITAAAGPGVQTNVRTMGTLDDDGWSWEEGLVFAGPAGTLTQVPPNTGWEIVIGNAPSPHRLNLTFDEPVWLA